MAWSEVTMCVKFFFPERKKRNDMNSASRLYVIAPQWFVNKLIFSSFFIKTLLTLWGSKPIVCATLLQVVRP